jgi:DNA-binding LacI/PurR family transcriptional regulator
LFCAQVVGGVEAVLSEAGYEVLVVGVAGPDARRRFVADIDRMHHRVDELLLVDIRLEADEAARVRNSALRVVTIGNSYPGLSSVRPDDISAARLAVDHLLNLGHRRIGLVEGMRDDPMQTEVSWRRREGYIQSLTRSGIVVDPNLLEAGDFSVVGAQEATHRLLDMSEPPTAIFAISDEMAMGARGVAVERGLAVPDDLSIVGIDDHPLSNTVALTTVRQDPPASGAMAARWIVEDLQNDQCVLYSHEVKTELVVRATTGPPKSERRNSAILTGRPSSIDRCAAAPIATDKSPS